MAAASEGRRSKMSFIDGQLDRYAKGRLPGPGSPVPDGPRAALELCQDLLELYRVEDITDYNLAQL